MGMRMPGWYDIADMGDLATRSDDEAGVLRSQKVFHTLIQGEIDAGIPTEIRSIDRSELYVCDEMFFVGTGVQVSPVIEIDHRAVGTGAVGAITRRISERYFAAVRGTLPDYLDWLTPVGS